jgi:hypothetical protein
MLSKLQDHLTDIYQADPGYRVVDFLITDRSIADALGGESVIQSSEETILLTEGTDELELSVFLDKALLERLRGHDPLQSLKAKKLQDVWTVLEGISHFNYIAWCAGRDKAVTLFELEMQAEVDKYVSTWLLALAQEDKALADNLHGWLFEDVSYHPELDCDQRARYKAANDLAARFCHGLRRRLRGNNADGLKELRRFYRLSQPEKISHIHAQAWAR